MATPTAASGSPAAAKPKATLQDFLDVLDRGAREPGSVGGPPAGLVRAQDVLDEGGLAPGAPTAPRVSWPAEAPALLVGRLHDLQLRDALVYAARTYAGGSGGESGVLEMMNVFDYFVEEATLIANLVGCPLDVPSAQHHCPSSRP